MTPETANPTELRESVTDVVAKPVLEGRHRAELHTSGLTDETIKAAGIYSADSSEVRKLLGWQPKDHDWGRGMVFPFLDATGKPTGYARVKLDYPRHDKYGKAIKYESPLKAPNRAYFPPVFTDNLSDSPTIVLTEGEKKSLAGSQSGHPCIGLVGVWGWQLRRPKTDNGKTYGKWRLIPDLDTIGWKGRVVVILFDSDAADNSHIQHAEWKLAETLMKAGATVLVARLPSVSEDGKTGVDDFLVHHGQDGPAELRKIISAAEPAEEPPKPSPMDWARMFIDEFFRVPDGRTLRWYRDEFYRWDGRRYVIVPDSELSAIAFGWLDERQKQTKPLHANEVVKALASLCRVPHDREIPCFLRGHEATEPRNIVAVWNGLLDITNIGGDLNLWKHTPQWFSTTALAYRFDKDAEAPRWQTFLDQVLDQDSQELLQRFLGLCLTADTSYQKLLLLVGPRRSGKGTIVRALQRLVGHDNCVSPTLSSLGSEFGKWPLLGKSLATLADAHIGRRTDGVQTLEVIKGIVGEDRQNVNRKNLAYLTNVKLTTRFVVTVNDLPRFSDDAGALGARLLPLVFERSFADCMDRHLDEKLEADASGILNWALRGLYSLRKADGFNTPEKSAELLANYRRLTSPVSGFLEDRCEVRAEAQTPCGELYEAWREWCEENGHEAGANNTFGEHIRSAASIKRKKRGPRGSRKPVYVGVRLNCGEPPA